MACTEQSHTFNLLNNAELFTTSLIHTRLLHFVFRVFSGIVVDTNALFTLC